MRKRKEIEIDANTLFGAKPGENAGEGIRRKKQEGLLLEVLLDIRDLLENPPIEITGQEIKPEVKEDNDQDDE